MNTLPIEFDRGGFDFKQMWREGNVAIYGKKKSEWKDFFAFETVIVRQRGEREAFGKVFEAGEYYPSSEEWGRFGWADRDFSHSQARARILVVGQIEKQGQAIESGGVE